MAVVGSKFGVRRLHLEAAGFQFTEADENGQVNVVVPDDMERPTACVQVASRRPPRHEDVSEEEVAERVQHVFDYLFACGPCAPLSVLGPMFRVRRQQLVETGLELTNDPQTGQTIVWLPQDAPPSKQEAPPRSPPVFRESLWKGLPPQRPPLGKGFLSFGKGCGKFARNAIPTIKTEDVRSQSSFGFGGALLNRGFCHNIYTIPAFGANRVLCGKGKGIGKPSLQKGAGVSTCKGVPSTAMCRAPVPSRFRTPLHQSEISEAVSGFLNEVGGSASLAAVGSKFNLKRAKIESCGFHLDPPDEHGQILVSFPRSHREPAPSRKRPRDTSVSNAEVPDEATSNEITQFLLEAGGAATLGVVGSRFKMRKENFEAAGFVIGPPNATGQRNVAPAFSDIPLPPESKPKIKEEALPVAVHWASERHRPAPSSHRVEQNRLGVEAKGKTRKVFPREAQDAPFGRFNVSSPVAEGGLGLPRMFFSP
uniref:Uncharacterized protein n=1 Tax=Noctiluca scintillans TaxID=2966 RepID=A0A7S0ZYD7_NOCSC|mmetsp:Transcript_23389/g.61429  ORF Transcript_23389/g.61429 Transcript_23389/m.61429 type:complete len:480 (+) Transcript_23389:3-1442(+)